MRSRSLSTMSRCLSGALRARWTSMFVAVFIVSLASIGADMKLTKQQADTFSRKIVAIAAQGERDPTRPMTRTQVTEGELNSWMVYSAQPLIPKGVTEPTVSILGNGRLSG